VLHRDVKTLQDTIKKIRKQFKDDMLRIEVLFVEEDELVNTVPFL
jgi:hypothetical protein